MFLEALQKHKFIFGVVISSISAILIVNNIIQLYDTIKTELTLLTLTLTIFISLFSWYTKMVTK